MESFFINNFFIDYLSSHDAPRFKNLIVNSEQTTLNSFKLFGELNLMN